MRPVSLFIAAKLLKQAWIRDEQQQQQQQKPRKA